MAMPQLKHSSQPIYDRAVNPPPGRGREEVDEHMARHVEAGWTLAFYLDKPGGIAFHPHRPLGYLDRQCQAGPLQFGSMVTSRVTDSIIRGGISYHFSTSYY